MTVAQDRRGVGAQSDRGGRKIGGAHHSEPYRLRIKYLCEDLVLCPINNFTESLKFSEN